MCQTANNLRHTSRHLVLFENGQIDQAIAQLELTTTAASDEATSANQFLLEFLRQPQTTDSGGIIQDASQIVISGLGSVDLVVLAA